MSSAKSNRREFFGKVAAGIAGGVGFSALVKEIPLFDPSMALAATAGVPYRKLGRSGGKVSIVGLGGD